MLSDVKNIVISISSKYGAWNINKAISYLVLKKGILVAMPHCIKLDSAFVVWKVTLFVA